MGASEAGRGAWPLILSVTFSAIMMVGALIDHTKLLDAVYPGLLVRYRHVVPVEAHLALLTAIQSR